jgi:hypothetical protein
VLAVLFLRSARGGAWPFTIAGRRPRGVETALPPDAELGSLLLIAKARLMQPLARATVCPMGDRCTTATAIPSCCAASFQQR